MSDSSRPVEVLLVEDSPTDRLFAIEALQQGAIPKVIRTVADGVEALDYLRQRGDFAQASRPDLIILDLNLPKKDGREVLEEIKADPSLKLIPVVILSTSRADADLLLAYAGHANSYVIKPLDLGCFGEMVDALENYWLRHVSLPPHPSCSPTVVEPALRETRIAVDPGTIHVLLLEDSSSDAYLIHEMLRENRSPRFEVTLVASLAQLREADRGTFDVVLTDLGLAASQGLETLRQVRAVFGFLPMIVLTGHTDEELGLAALREGAQDFLSKQHLSRGVLSRALRFAVEKRGIEERRRLAQKMEGLGRLTAGIAHDFNNLLTVICGQAEALQRSVREAPAEDSLREILSASERATALTRQLLTFSRQQVMQREFLDLPQVVRDLLPVVRQALGENIALEADLDMALPSAEADAGMVGQAVLNLALNARDALPEGGTFRLTMGEIEFSAAEVRRHPDSYAGLFVWLRAGDSGRGIPAHLRERIFEPFFTTKDASRGAGLGLATLHSIMVQHRGWVELASPVGAGATFTLFFPASRRPPGAGARALQSPARRGTGETILLVEDEPAVRLVARIVLAGNGYKVLEASTGDEALAIWQKHSSEIQLLLTDMVLPDGMSGAQLAERIRASCPRLEVILTSGYSDELVRQEGPPQGIEFLPKPYAAARLLGAVRSSLQKAARAPSPAAPTSGRAAAAGES